MVQIKTLSKKKKEQSIQEPKVNIKWYRKYVIEVIEEDREWIKELYIEVVAEIFFKITIDIKPQMQPLKIPNIF